jgi:hypothetical protein
MALSHPVVVTHRHQGASTESNGTFRDDEHERNVQRRHER